MRSFRNKLLNKIGEKLGILVYNANKRLARTALPRFGNNPKNLVIELPRRITGSEHMIIGDDVALGPGSFLLALVRYQKHHERYPRETQEFNPRLIIGNRVTSTGALEIGAMEEIIIEDDVMFASNVYITDGSHGLETANIPYKYQKMSRISPVKIEMGCWIGRNVTILAGVTIGKLTIIGANSVVTKSIPPRCIAVGTPARVTKVWEEDSQCWVSAHSE